MTSLTILAELTDKLQAGLERGRKDGQTNREVWDEAWRRIDEDKIAEISDQKIHGMYYAMAQLFKKVYEPVWFSKVKTPPHSK